MSRTADFSNPNNENSSRIPPQWIYQSVTTVLNLLLTDHIVLNKCRLGVLGLYFDVSIY